MPDCPAEWVVENPRNRKGQTSRVQLCRQGDASCDFDLNGRQCTFLVRVCLNNVDVNLPGCTPTEVSAYRLKLKAKKLFSRADTHGIFQFEGSGRLAEAKACYERAIAFYTPRYGPRHYEVAMNLHVEENIEPAITSSASRSRTRPRSSRRARPISARRA